MRNDGLSTQDRAHESLRNPKKTWRRRSSSKWKEEIAKTMDNDSEGNESIHAKDRLFHVSD
jgi:hypothetical protein